MSNLFIHPATVFIGFAFLLLFWPAKSRLFRWIMLVPAVVSLVSLIFLTKQGSYGTIAYLGQTLEFGRVDRLSLVFANIFAIQAIIGIIYAFHLKDKAHHIAGLLYVAGAFGCTFAGDYRTLFFSCELMTLASTFFLWLARNPPATMA